MKIHLKRSKRLPFPPSAKWTVGRVGDMFEIDLWHMATFKGYHVVRFAIDDRQFEVYFPQSGRVVHLYPVERAEDRTTGKLEESIKQARRKG